MSWPDNRKGEMEMFANIPEVKLGIIAVSRGCLLYTSDAADE